MKVEKKELHWKVQKRAEKMAERWRRALACHPKEIAKAEIIDDLMMLNTYILRNEKYYPEMSMKMHRTLYNVMLQMKDSVIQKRSAGKKSLMSFRISERARFKLEHLAERGGVSMTTVIENLIYSCNRFQINVPEQK